MGRIIMVVTVWLVMAAMMLIIAIPVIAKGNDKEPGEQGPPSQSGTGNPGTSPDVFHGNGGACVVHPTGKTTGGGCPEFT
jgi:hypothetical protein